MIGILQLDYSKHSTARCIPIVYHTCQPNHFILLETLFIFAGHQEKLQDTLPIIMYIYTKLLLFMYMHAHACGHDAVAAC